MTRPFANVCRNTPSMMMTEPMMMVYFLPIFSTSHQRKNCEKTPPRPWVPLKIPSLAPVG
jgi:hypothetical protein